MGEQAHQLRQGDPLRDGGLLDISNCPDAVERLAQQRGEVSVSLVDRELRSLTPTLPQCLNDVIDVGEV